MKTNSPPVKTAHVSRRQFLKTSGGLSFAVVTAGFLPGCSATSLGDGDAVMHKLSAWVSIAEDGIITILNPAAEMGQGSMTALAAIIAEEMDADWNQVKIDYSPIESDIYGLGWGGQLGGSMLTVGSRTVMGYYQNLRIAGAQVRKILVDAAAQQLDVSQEELTTAENKVIHTPTQRTLGYGEIAASAILPEVVPDIQPEQLKDPADFKLIGKNGLRYDIPEKVDGTAKFALDVHLPGMVYGVVSRSPVNGAKPESWNQQDIAKLPGVLDQVSLEHGVGVLAESIEDAFRAKAQLQIKWSQAPADSHNSGEAFENYRTIAGKSKHEGSNLETTGNALRTIAKSRSKYSADYKNDYVYHCQMEPLNSVASVSEDGSKVDVWAGSQAPDNSKNAVAEALGIESSSVNFHQCYLGGGFGRRTLTGYVTESAILSAKIKKPVKLIWTREDDVQYGAFRPQSLQRMQASVDSGGKINAWSHIIVGPGGGLLGSGARIPYYKIANKFIEVRSIDHGVRTKHWRSVGHGPNKYAIEAFLDEIAHSQGIDPLQLRLDLMSDSPRERKVLETAAEMADWGSTPDSGRAKGIAFIERSRSFAAAVCEISLDATSGQIRVHRIWSALDAGLVIQPDNVIAQMEGGMIMGISSVLKERISFKNGKVEQSNFHDYSIIRMSEVPDEIHVRIIDSTVPPTGVGESGTPLMGGAIANAFSMLTGKYLRDMPFTPEKVKAVLET